MIKKQVGVGLIEVMIAVALIALAAVVVATLATQTHESSGLTAAHTDCTSRADAVLSVFKNADNKIQMGNFHASVAQPFPTAPYPHLERFARPLANPTPGNSLASQYTNGWELINSGSNWALALYNVTGAVNFCSTPFVAGPADEIFPGVAPAGFAAWGPPNPLYPPGTQLPNEKIYLNIQRKDFRANTLDCSNQGKQRLVPLSPTNGTDADPTLGNYVGMQVSVNIQFTDSLGNLSQCSRSTLLRPDGDSVAPSFLAVPADILPGGVCLPANCNCSVASNLCIFNAPPGLYETAGPPILCGNPVVSVSAADSEPGTVFGCELDFSATNPPPSVPIPFYQPCTSFVSGAVTGKVTAIHLAADNSTGIKIDLTGLTNLGFYTLFIEAMDSAQNPTMEFIQFQYKSVCP